MQSKKKNTSETFSNQPFRDLKTLLSLKKAPAAPPVHEKRAESTPAHDEEELFRKAMQDVREIKEFRALPVRPSKTVPAYRATSSDREALRNLEEITLGKRPLHLPDTQEYVEWTNEDYHLDIVRKLHKGIFAVQDYLDLHGLILDEAEAEVDRFIGDALKKRLRCVKIIHGRGLRSPNGPILKDAVVNRLIGRYKKHLIAFVTARQCDGGLGALYILLR